MANRKKKRHPLAKGPIVGVRLNDEDMATLEECARLESEQRREIVHESQLLRELGMPQIRARLAELRSLSAQADGDRGVPVAVGE